MIFSGNHCHLPGNFQGPQKLVKNPDEIYSYVYLYIQKVNLDETYQVKPSETIKNEKYQGDRI